MEGNQLQTLPAGVFDSLAELKTLGLEKNQLWVLP
uniref:Variable lymphocyte receptor A cassette n=1 Tax=Petromyzon marinus TaxID=7757 RepID=S4S194_PETMA